MSTCNKMISKTHIDLPGDPGYKGRFYVIRAASLNSHAARRAVLTLLNLGDLEYEHSGGAIMSDEAWADFQSEVDSMLEANVCLAHDRLDNIHDVMARNHPRHSHAVIEAIVAVAYGKKVKPPRKHYVVQMRLRSGDIEKSKRKLVIARTKQAAVRQALLGECHYDMRAGAKWLRDNEVEDVHGEWIYRVEDVVLVHPDDVKTLEKYL